jgi:hypothetical protein
MSESLLPPAFAHLEPYARDWALGEEAARNTKRLSSTMPELRNFYDALLPQVESIIDYLRPMPLDSLADPEQRLLNLAMTFMEVAPSIEIFFAVDVPGGFEAERFKILPPFAQTAAQS